MVYFEYHGRHLWRRREQRDAGCLVSYFLLRALLCRYDFLDGFIFLKIP